MAHAPECGEDLDDLAEGDPPVGHEVGGVPLGSRGSQDRGALFPEGGERGWPGPEVLAEQLQLRMLIPGIAMEFGADGDSDVATPSPVPLQSGHPVRTHRNGYGRAPGQSQEDPVDPNRGVRREEQEPANRAPAKVRRSPHHEFPPGDPVPGAFVAIPVRQKRQVPDQVRGVHLWRKGPTLAEAGRTTMVMTGIRPATRGPEKWPVIRPLDGLSLPPSLTAARATP